MKANVFLVLAAAGCIAVAFVPTHRLTSWWPWGNGAGGQKLYVTVIEESGERTVEQRQVYDVLDKAESDGLILWEAKDKDVTDQDGKPVDRLVLLIERAKKKGLPYLFVGVKKPDRELWEGKLPLTPEAMQKLLAGYGGYTETVTIRGRTWKLAALPRRSRPGENVMFKPFAQVVGRIPRDKWKQVTIERHVQRIMDQNGYGSCGAEAACQAVEVCRDFGGLPAMPLSAGVLYRFSGGGGDNGSSLEDNLRYLVSQGTTDETTVPHLEMNPRKWPSNWKENAKRYRVLEAFDCETFDDMASALQLGFPVVTAIDVGGNFDTAADGWVPAAGRGGGGHALCAVGLYRDEKHGWGLKLVNSWRADWGDKGFGIVPESYWSRNGYSDSWAVRVVVHPGEKTDWRRLIPKRTEADRKVQAAGLATAP